MDEEQLHVDCSTSVLFPLHSLFEVSPSDSSERQPMNGSSFVRERKAENVSSTILIHLKRKKETSEPSWTLWLPPQNASLSRQTFLSVTLAGTDRELASEPP